MSHRAAQIIDRIAELLGSNVNLRAKVFSNRALSLSEMDAELPAITVNFSSDTPGDNEDLSAIASSLDVSFVSYALGETEAEVLAALLEIRRQVHITLMEDTSLGLSFVWHVVYGGASAPILEAGDRIAGSLQANWAVRYVMNISDPE